MSRLHNKIAVIAGGGGNIGSATSLIFAREEAVVVVADIDEKKGHNAIDAVHDFGGSGMFVRTNIEKLDEVKYLIQETVDTYGHIDVLVNMVGGTSSIKLDETDETMLENDLSLNLKSGIFCTQAVLPYMMSQKNGSIIYISSVNALCGGFSQTVYASAKAGLHSLAQTLTADYARYGLRFNVVCLGTIPGKSPRWQERQDEEPDTLDNLARMYPCGRYGNPTDAANAILFLASDEASWITGITLTVDGGITATGGLKGGKWWAHTA